MNEDLVKILFGKKIKRLRHNMNLTQFALGELANINQRQVTLIESGKSFPSLKTIIKFADIFSSNSNILLVFLIATKSSPNELYAIIVVHNPLEYTVK